MSESIEDIVREMRENTVPTDYTDTKYPSEVNEMLLGFADRIEAADAAHCDGCKLLVEDVRRINVLKDEIAHLREEQTPDFVAVMRRVDGEWREHSRFASVDDAVNAVGFEKSYAPAGAEFAIWAVRQL